MNLNGVQKVFACPHCGKVSFWSIVFLGFKEKDKCLFCQKSVKIGKGFCNAKRTATFICFILFYRFSREVVVFVKGSQAIHTVSTFTILLDFYLTALFVFLFSVMVFRTRDRVFSSTLSEGNNAKVIFGELTDKAVQSNDKKEKEAIRSIFCCDVCGKKMGLYAILFNGIRFNKSFRCVACGKDMKYRHDFVLKRVLTFFLFGLILELIVDYFNIADYFIKDPNVISKTALEIALSVIASWIISTFLCAFMAPTRDDVFMPLHDESEDDGTDR